MCAVVINKGVDDRVTSRDFIPPDRSFEEEDDLPNSFQLPISMYDNTGD